MMELFPNIFELFEVLIRKIGSRPYVFPVKVILQDVIDNLIAFLHFKLIEIDQKTGQSSLW